jgi:hypothetical protein
MIYTSFCHVCQLALNHTRPRQTMAIDYLGMYDWWLCVVFLRVFTVLVLMMWRWLDGQVNGQCWSFVCNHLYYLARKNFTAEQIAFLLDLYNRGVTRTCFHREIQEAANYLNIEYERVKVSVLCFFLVICWAEVFGYACEQYSANTYMHRMIAWRQALWHVQRVGKPTSMRATASCQLVYWSV